MTKLVRTLFITHLATFAAGVYVGKSIDADELELYRSAHESTFARIVRKAEAVGIAVLVAGALLFSAKVVAGATATVAARAGAKGTAGGT
jgi:hypothetical protein